MTLTSFPPAQIAFIRARIDDGAMNSEICQEFGVSHPVVTAIRKSTQFSKRHVDALRKGLPGAFTSIVSSSLSSINPEKLQSCSAPQLMMVAGIAYDKLRLSMDQSTANIAFKDVGTMASEGLQSATEALKTLISTQGITE